MAPTSNYPAGYDSIEKPNAADPLNDPRVPHAAQHDIVNSAVEAIEHTLGLHPQGTSATVDARITKVEGRALPAAAPADMGKTPVVQADGSYALGAASGGGASLSDAAPHDPGATAAAGTGTKASRDDHVHQRETPMLKPADKIGAVLTLDAGRTAAWVDPLALATVVPADLATTAKVGTATEAAKADHVHALPLATTAPSDPAAVAAKGVAELAARADHQHKAELPAHVAADANKVLTVDASGTTVAWKPTTDVTELKSAVANEAALPATGNTVGDIRVTLDDGNMHVWIAATVTPAVAAHWDKIGPAAANMTLATVAAKDPAAAAAIGVSTSAAREDHQHKAELPAHGAGDASKYLAVDVGGAAAWKAPSPSITPLGVHFIDPPGFPMINVNAASATAKVSLTGLASLPVAHRQFFVAGGLIKVARAYKGTPRTYRIVKDFPAAVWTATDPIPEATWGPHGADEYFAWEDVAAALADGGTMGKYDYAVPEIPVHTEDENYNDILRVSRMNTYEWRAPTRFVEPSYTGDWTPAVGTGRSTLFNNSTKDLPQMWFAYVQQSPYRALFKAGNVIKITDRDGRGDFYYRIIKDLPDAIFDTPQPAGGQWIDCTVYGETDQYIAWEDIASAAAAIHRVKGPSSVGGWSVQGDLFVRTKAPRLPAFTAADAGKTLAINPAGTGLMWK